MAPLLITPPPLACFAAYISETAIQKNPHIEIYFTYKPNYTTLYKKVPYFVYLT